MVLVPTPCPVPPFSLGPTSSPPTSGSGGPGCRTDRDPGPESHTPPPSTHGSPLTPLGPLVVFDLDRRGPHLSLPSFPPNRPRPPLVSHVRGITPTRTRCTTHRNPFTELERPEVGGPDV